MYGQQVAPRSQPLQKQARVVGPNHSAQPSANLQHQLPLQQSQLLSQNTSTDVTTNGPFFAMQQNFLKDISAVVQNATIQNNMNMEAMKNTIIGSFQHEVGSLRQQLNTYTNKNDADMNSLRADMNNLQQQWKSFRESSAQQPPLAANNRPSTTSYDPSSSEAMLCRRTLKIKPLLFKPHETSETRKNLMKALFEEKLKLGVVELERLGNFEVNRPLSNRKPEDVAVDVIFENYKDRDFILGRIGYLKDFRTINMSAVFPQSLWAEKNRLEESGRYIREHCQKKIIGDRELPMFQTQVRYADSPWANLSLFIKERAVGPWMPILYARKVRQDLPDLPTDK